MVACDVRTRFVDAAEVFAPQKGATPAQVALLTGRLERLVQVYQEDIAGMRLGLLPLVVVEYQADQVRHDHLARQAHLNID